MARRTPPLRVLPVLLLALSMTSLPACGGGEDDDDDDEDDLEESMESEGEMLALLKRHPR